MVRKIIFSALVAAVCFLSSCGSVDDCLCCGIKDSIVDLEPYYWGGLDSVVSKKDSMIVYNSRMDTVIIETGIFSYLKFDYRIYSSIPDSVYCPLKKAIALEKQGLQDDANKFHQVVLNYYRTGWRSSTSSDEYWTDLNAVMTHRVNTSILISYSLDKLGFLDESIDVLKHYISNYETHGTKIYLRFIEQCIKKYGADSVRLELRNSVQTLSKIDIPEGSLYDDIVIKVYGANMGVSRSSYRHSVDSIDVLKFMKEQDFYFLIK